MEAIAWSLLFISFCVVFRAIFSVLRLALQNISEEAERRRRRARDLLP